MSKEWKGNKNAVQAQHGIKSDYTTKGREQDDFYATDPQALERLLNGLSKHMQCVLMDMVELDSLWWECACGNGNLAKVLVQRDYRVISTDLKNRGYGKSGVDFLKHNGKFKLADGTVTPEIIITNPPYSHATEFIEHALQILPVGGTISR